MANDIRISGDELQWRSAANNVFSTTGVLETDLSGTHWDNRIAGSLYIDNNDLYFIDRSGSRKRRRCVKEFLGTSTTAKTQSICIDGAELKFAVQSGTPGTMNVYKVVDGAPPSQQPSNLTITKPVTVFTYPYDARVNWTNTNTTDRARIRWYRNGSLVETATVSAGSTSHLSSSTYWSSGQEIEVTVSYYNDFGEGPAAIQTTTA